MPAAADQALVAGWYSSAVGETALPAGHQHVAVSEERRGVRVARDRHGSRRRPGVRRGVEELGRGQGNAAAAATAGHEHLPVREQCGGGRVRAGRRHAPPAADQVFVAGS